MKSTGISNEAIFSFYQTSMALCRKFIELTLNYKIHGIRFFMKGIKEQDWMTKLT